MCETTDDGDPTSSSSSIVSHELTDGEIGGAKDFSDDICTCGKAGSMVAGLGRRNAGWDWEEGQPDDRELEKEAFEKNNRNLAITK